MIGLDLAKNTFQAHGASADGSVAFREKLRRDNVMTFFAEQSRCTVAMKAGASAGLTRQTQTPPEKPVQFT